MIMGLFGKLFGKKNNVQEVTTEPTRTPVPTPVPEPKPVLPDPPKPPKEHKLITYKEREQMIQDNPLSSLYRREKQQESASMHTMEWDQFKTKCKGRFIALDFETTGLDCESEEIIEISAVRVDKGEIVDSYHTYVDPNKNIPRDAYEINHITDNMVAGKPYIWQVLPDLLDFIGTGYIVAHNAEFDYRFLAMSCMRYRFKIPTKWFDSMDLKELWPKAKNRKLCTILAAAGIENQQAHSASGDAEALAKLVIASMEKDANP